MDKILSKSRSRYLFGVKKKSVAKDQGISSSDLHTTAPESRNENFGALSGRSSPPYVTDGLFHAGKSVAGIGESPKHHVRDSPRLNYVPGGDHFSHKMHILDSPSSTPSPDHGSLPQSRFDLHISPTPFSPIVMSSSTPPRNAYSPSVSTAPLQHREISPSKSKAVGDRIEYPRTGDALAHSRSQYALGSQGRFRRHGIPESFMDMSETTTNVAARWNGKSSSAERFITDALTSAQAPSSSSNLSLVRPSASAPVTSNLSNPQVLPDLAPLRESSTVPAMPAHFSLPRSNGNYNLAGLMPKPPAPSPTKRPPEADTQNPPSQSHRAQPSHEFDRPPPHYSPPAIASSGRYHTHSASASSEKGIGYKGLAFPLPPSSDEGLATPYSSSQSSLTSARNAGDMPTTPKKPREANEERVAKTPKTLASHSIAVGTGARPRVNTSDGRTSPTLNVAARRKGDKQDVSHAGPDTQVEGETIMTMQERVGKELDHVLRVDLAQSGLNNASFTARHTRPTAEEHRDASSGSPLQSSQRPKLSETTKPLTLASGRKMLHTMRSFSTGLNNERKQLHVSKSSRDLSAKFNTPAPAVGNKIFSAIPVHAPGASSQTDAQPPTQPRLLPTPPPSSSALSSLAGEQKGSDNPPQQRPTLEEVTNALHRQNGRFDELAGYVLELAQRQASERQAYEGRVVRLEDAAAKMEQEIQGLRWLVLENAKMRQGAVEEPAAAATAAVEQSSDKVNEMKRKLRRSLTMPQLAKFPQHRPTHPRSKRDAIGLGLGFSPDSVLTSPGSPFSPPDPKRSSGLLPAACERTPNMDEIIDKLMGVRQWASADVRVSVVDEGGTGGGDSKRIVFREP